MLPTYNNENTNDDNYENTFYGFLGVKPFHALISSMSGSFTL
jgi:hypothetical protein